MITEAMILAAGRGERMRPLTDQCPKPLQKIGQLTLIERHLYALSQAGVNHVVINVAWLGEMITTFLGNGERYNLTIDYSYEETALGTLGGIVNALPLLTENQFLVLSADIVTDFNFKAFLTQHIQPNDVAHLVLIKESAFKGDFSISGERILPLLQPGFTYANIGLYKREPLLDFTPGEILDLGQYLRNAVSHDRVSGQLFDGFWSNVGTIEELARLNQIMGK